MKFLKENSIALAAALISLLTLITSFYQWKASQLQADVAKAQLIPNIEVEAIFDNQNSSNSNMESIKIKSTGGPAFNLKFETLSIVPIESGNYLNFKKFHDYFTKVERSGLPTGTVAVISGRNNFTEYTEFASDIEEITQHKNPIYVGSPRVLVKIEYTDALKETHKEFFQSRYYMGEKYYVITDENKWAEMIKVPEIEIFGLSKDERMAIASKLLIKDGTVAR